MNKRRLPLAGVTCVLALGKCAFGVLSQDHFAPTALRLLALASKADIHMNNRSKKKGLAIGGAGLTSQTNMQSRP